jgi:hypothetical protein
MKICDYRGEPIQLGSSMTEAMVEVEITSTVICKFCGQTTNKHVFDNTLWTEATSKDIESWQGSREISKISDAIISGISTHKDKREESY